MPIYNKIVKDSIKNNLCLECNTIITDMRLSTHFKMVHNLSIKDYIIKFDHNNIEPSCAYLECINKVKINDLHSGLQMYCNLLTCENNKPKIDERFELSKELFFKYKNLKNKTLTLTHAELLKYSKTSRMYWVCLIGKTPVQPMYLGELQTYLLSNYNISIQDYYNLICNVKHEKCYNKDCNNLTSFMELSLGYTNCCNFSCANIVRIKEAYTDPNNYINSEEHCKWLTLNGGNRMRQINLHNEYISEYMIFYICKSKINENVIKFGIYNCIKNSTRISELETLFTVLYSVKIKSSYAIKLEIIISDLTKDDLYFEENRHDLVYHINGVSELRYISTLETILNTVENWILMINKLSETEQIILHIKTI